MPTTVTNQSDFDKFKAELGPLLAPFLTTFQVNKLLEWLFKLKIEPFTRSYEALYNYPDFATITDPEVQKRYTAAFDKAWDQDKARIEGFETKPLGSVNLKTETLQVEGFGEVLIGPQYKSAVKRTKAAAEQAFRLQSMVSPFRYITHRSHVIYFMVHELRNNVMPRYYALCLWWVYYMDAVLLPQGIDLQACQRALSFNKDNRYPRFIKPYDGFPVDSHHIMPLTEGGPWWYSWVLVCPSPFHTRLHRARYEYTKSITDASGAGYNFGVAKQIDTRIDTTHVKNVFNTGEFKNFVGRGPQQMANNTTPTLLKQYNRPQEWSHATYGKIRFGQNGTKGQVSVIHDAMLTKVLAVNPTDPINPAAGSTPQTVLSTSTIAARRKKIRQQITKVVKGEHKQCYGWYLKFLD